MGSEVPSQYHEDELDPGRHQQDDGEGQRPKNQTKQYPAPLRHAPVGNSILTIAHRLLSGPAADISDLGSDWHDRIAPLLSSDFQFRA
jgi:hypothetical protein